jgi:hypothetical protein
MFIISKITFLMRNEHFFKRFKWLKSIKVYPAENFLLLLARDVNSNGGVRGLFCHSCYRFLLAGRQQEQ